MHRQPIEQKTKRVLEIIAKESFSKNFYLTGDTALAILLEHIESIDLAWFKTESFSHENIKNN